MNFMNVLWHPHPKQVIFYRTSEQCSSEICIVCIFVYFDMKI